MPVVTRVVTRGKVGSWRSDISSFELFAVSPLKIIFPLML